MEEKSKRQHDASEIEDLADEQLSLLRAHLPEDPSMRFILFMEMQRVLDLRSIGRSSFQSKADESQHYSVLKWGMNIATAELLVALPQQGGIPMMASSPEIKGIAESALREFGAIALLKRAAEMIRFGLMELETDSEELVFRCSESVHFQLLDRLEPQVWREAEAAWTKNEIAPQGWTILASDAGPEVERQTGAFWRRRAAISQPLHSWEEVKAIMIGLVRPWPTPHGVFIGYDADPLVDDFYTMRAAAEIEVVFSDAGIHPATKFDGFTGLDLVRVLILLIGINRKHVDFCFLLKETCPEVDILDCFTLWEPRGKLVDSIASELSIDTDLVARVLACLTVFPEDATRMSLEHTPVLPLIIDLGNGMILRPVSSLTLNPLEIFKLIAQWRIPSAMNAIFEHREKWLRNDLYSIFGGRRYICIPGGVMLRKNGKKLTDIDAAIFDRTNGELALFQLKWQDYATDSVRKMSSRAKNFAGEVDHWADVVAGWLNEQSPTSLAQALRLNVKKHEVPLSVFLFVLSKDVARTHGFGHPVKSKWLSVATWPQLFRLRGLLGPVPNVISAMHEILRLEEYKHLEGYSAKEYRFCLRGGRRVVIDGLWFVENPADQE